MSGQPRIRILLVDGKELVRAALTLLLNRESGLTVVAQVAELSAVLDVARRERPHLVIVALDLPDLMDVEMVSLVRRQLNGARLLALAAYDGPGYVAVARSVGAHGFASKEGPARALIEAIRTIARGDEYWPEAPAWASASRRSKRIVRPSCGGWTSRTCPRSRASPSASASCPSDAALPIGPDPPNFP